MSLASERQVIDLETAKEQLRGPAPAPKKAAKKKPAKKTTKKPAKKRAAAKKKPVVDDGWDKGAEAYRQDVDKALCGQEAVYEAEARALTAEGFRLLDEKRTELFHRMKAARAARKQVASDTKERIQATEGSMDEAHTIGIDWKKPAADKAARRKLQRCEVAYQDWKEAKAEAKERRSDANNDLKAAEKDFDSFMANPRQMLLPGTERD